VPHDQPAKWRPGGDPGNDQYVEVRYPNPTVPVCAGVTLSSCAGGPASPIESAGGLPTGKRAGILTFGPIYATNPPAKMM
jgi:hypothetical protein